MPRTKGKGRGAGGSGSRGSGSKPRRGRAPASRPTSTVTTRSIAAQAEPSPSSQSGRRPRAAGTTKEDEVKPSKRAKKTKARSQKDEDADSASSVSSQADTVAAEGVSDRASVEEEGSAAAPDAAASDSSQVSSPVRVPYLPEAIKFQNAQRVVYETSSSADICAYHVEKAKYIAKIGRQRKLLTLDKSGPLTCLDDELLISDQESAEQMVFQSAKAVLGLTSYIDGKLLAQCSGFLIDLDKETGHGTVLTSANLLCTKSPQVDQWSFPREYAPDAEVRIHLLDDTIQKGTLINYHKHYNIALFEVVMKMSAKLPLSPDLIEYGQEVFLIGRDETLNLHACYGRVERVDPGLFEHYHFMYVECGVDKFVAGGPVIDKKGRVLGMANPTPKSAFIPTPFILKCLRMWRDLKCVPRLHVGLKLSSIKFLHSSHKEKISRKFNIDAGLIVQEVSEGSPAEKIGIRKGDVMESLNGKCFHNTVELEIMLLSTCEHCLEKGDGLGSNVDFTVGLFQIRKEKRCTKKLTLNVSDDLEVIAQGTYAVSAKVKNIVDSSGNTSRDK